MLHHQPLINVTNKPNIVIYGLVAVLVASCTTPAAGLTIAGATWAHPGKPGLHSICLCHQLHRWPHKLHSQYQDLPARLVTPTPCCAVRLYPSTTTGKTPMGAVMGALHTSPPLRRSFSLHEVQKKHHVQTATPINHTTTTKPTSQSQNRKLQRPRCLKATT